MMSFVDTESPGWLSLCRLHASTGGDTVFSRVLRQAGIHSELRYFAPRTEAPNGHAVGELRPKPAGNTRRVWEASRDTALTYRMIAERENETVKIERTSSLLIVAKARI